ncbi:CDP-alcohol phosphatidyltransferase family protein [Rhodovibrionaceae bacterium A322]
MSDDSQQPDKTPQAQPDSEALPGRHGKRKVLHLRTVVPNLVTVLSLVAGLTSIRFAVEESYRLAVVMILLAGLLDGLDGRVARLLKGETSFGAELDSLADFVNFGVAPAILVYLWALQGSSLGHFGWLASLILAICCGLRLARFNVMLDDPDKPEWSKDFFTGVPAPLVGALALLPIFLGFQDITFARDYPLITAIYLGIVGFLAVSQIPTFSFKRAKIRRQSILPALIIVAVFGTILLSNPWLAMTLVDIGYLAIIPLSIRAYRKRINSITL